MITEEECGGRCVDCSPSTVIARNPKIVSAPIQCRICQGQFYIFDMPGHPDNGEIFACSVMLENMRDNGNKPFPCTYLQRRDIAPIIDAEESKPGCFGAFGSRSCISKPGFCQWVARCKQCQEDY